MSDIRLCQGIMKNRVETEQCKFSCTSDFTVVSIYRYPHNFCKYEMLLIHCCIIIPLICGLSCGLQKLYMHKHGSGNRLEQERKQHTFSCHPSISHARAPSAHAQPAPRRLCARGNVKRLHTRVHLPCRFILQLLLQKFHFSSLGIRWLRTILLTAVCFKASLYIAAQHLYVCVHLILAV